MRVLYLEQVLLVRVWHMDEIVVLCERHCDNVVRMGGAPDACMAHG